MTATPKHAWTFHPPQFSPKAPAIFLRNAAVRIGAVQLVTPNVEDAKTVAMAPHYEDTFLKVLGHTLFQRQEIRDLSAEQARQILSDIQALVIDCAAIRNDLPDSIPFQP